MTALSLETVASGANPIDLVEEIVQANEWAHDRASDEELVVEIAGRWCGYRLLFVWQRDIERAAFHLRLRDEGAEAAAGRGVRAARSGQ